MCILLNISIYFRKALDLRARSSRNKLEWGNSFFRFTLKENSVEKYNLRGRRTQNMRYGKWQ